DLLDKEFVCALDKCKGACCVAGDSGAPLEYKETTVLEEIYESVKPYMTAEGIESVETFGNWLIDSDGDFVTPLVKGREQCAYVFFDHGIAKCAIEKAYNEGKVGFKKPVSCHLYPVRISKFKDYDAVNYNKWEVCSPACKNGKELGVPVYRFVKDALIRRYGIDWYDQLQGAADFKKKQQAAIK
ncbi:MAG TPA: DUF3109 family protein, partial [Chitinophagales bacterium]|nr:DUF3109 family protein [Chitinophagales bacterium]